HRSGSFVGALDRDHCRLWWRRCFASLGRRGEPSAASVWKTEGFRRERSRRSTDRVMILRVEDRVSILTLEQHAELMGDLSSHPEARAELFLELAHKLAGMVSDPQVDADTRRGAAARLDAAWLVLSGVQNDDKARRRLLLAAAVKSAANAPTRTMPERVEHVM